MLNSLSPDVISIIEFLPSRNVTGCPSGKDLTISKSFFPETVIAPGSSIVASKCVLRPTSRSVPVISTSFAPA